MTSYHLVNLYWLLDSIPLHMSILNVKMFNSS
jgi:hypothetical protein